MARPRKVTDDAVFEATFRLMNRLGPTNWTLADVAGEVGITPSALVQRYGSKRALLVSLMGQWSSSASDLFASLRRDAASPLAAIRAYADCVAQLGATPSGYAHHLAYLEIDLTDPDLHGLLRAYALDVRAELQSLLDDAVSSGELEHVRDTAALARAIEVTLNGSLLTWAIHQDGSARDAVHRDLDALLEPPMR